MVELGYGGILGWDSKKGNMLLGINIELDIDAGANALPSPPGEKFLIKYHRSGRARLLESS